MFNLYHNLLDALTDPAKRHAMMVHMPIMLSMVAMVTLVLLAMSRGKSARWRIITLVLLVLGILFCKLATGAGEAAVDQLNLPLTAQASELLEAHEEAGESLWLFFALIIVLVIPTWFKFMFVRYPAMALSLIAGLILLLRVTMVAHDGGSLVYDHGVGVPATPNNVQMSSDLADE